MQKYIDRLTKEWNTHGKIVIGVDFDSTLYPYGTIDNSEDIAKVIVLLKDCRFVGCYIMIHTASSELRHPEIKTYCEEIGIKVDSINSNPINLPYGNEGKPYANIYLDDRAGLNEACTILSEALYRQRSYLRSQIHLDEIG